MKTNVGDEIKSLWQLAWPILIGQLASVGMSVIDIIMIGHLSAEDLVSVSLGSSLWVIVIVTLMGIIMSVNVVVAFEIGAKNLKEIPHIMR